MVHSNRTACFKTHSHFPFMNFPISIFNQIVDNSSLLHVRRDQSPEERVVPLVRQLRGEKRILSERADGGQNAVCEGGGKRFQLYLDGGGGVAQHCDLRRRRRPITSIPAFAFVYNFNYLKLNNVLFPLEKSKKTIFSPTWYACSTGETARETEL